MILLKNLKKIRYRIFQLRLELVAVEARVRGLAPERGGVRRRRVAYGVQHRKLARPEGGALRRNRAKEEVCGLLHRNDRPAEHEDLS